MLIPENNPPQQKRAQSAHFQTEWICGGTAKDSRLQSREKPYLVALASCLQHDRYRPVVVDLYEHSSPEATSRNGDPVRLESTAERDIQRLSILGPGCSGEARPVAPSGIGKQRELTDHERRARDIDHAAIELPLVVLEHPKLRDPPSQPVDVQGGVAGGDAKQHTYAETDLADDLCVSRYPRRADTLDERSQWYT